MGSGETALRGAEGERRSSQAKGPISDDTPKRPDGNARPPKVQPPAGEGISQVTQRGHKAVMSGFVSFFAAQKRSMILKEEKRMSKLKRTQLYDVHVAAGAEMVDFGGWEMPIQYPAGIIAEHL